MGSRVSKRHFTCISFSGNGVNIKGAAYDIPSNIAPQVYMAGIAETMPAGAAGVHIIVGDAFVNHAQNKVEAPKPAQSKPKLRLV
jgi:hypothetical protein